MKKIFSAPLVTLLLLSVVFVKCSRKIPETASSISPPFKNVDVQFTGHEIDANAGGVIKLENGTCITIPPDAFVDESGNPIKGKVNINYREFHNAGDVLVSGIPMKYGNENFQTAGMFDIRATTANKDIVALREGKSIKVEMASFAEGDYNFYYFDEKEGKWTDKGTAPAKDNEEKKIALASLTNAGVAPVRPVKQAANSLVFDLDINMSRYPEYEYFKGVVWQYAGTDSKTDPAKSQWVFSENWTNVDLEKIEGSANKFNLKLSNGSKNFATVVTPVLNGKNYRNALARFESDSKEYVAAAENRKAQTAYLDQQADLIRTFTVNNFGIYNWDCLYKKQQNVLTIKSKFELDKHIAGVNMNNLMGYLVTAKMRAVLPFTTWDNGVIMFNPGDDNRLVVLLPDNRIAVFGNEQFKQLVNSVRNEENPSYTFRLKVVDKKVDSPAVLNDILRSI